MALGSERPCKVIIIGGSIAGLMCGVTLRHAGNDVTILEQGSDKRQSHMAGIGLGPDGETFLKKHDRMSPTPLSNAMYEVRLAAKDGSTKVMATGVRHITSWNSLYFRLRALFDGYVSEYYPEPCGDVATDGKGVYLAGKKVVDIVRDETATTESKIGEGCLTVSVRDGTTQEVEQLKADYVIGADGPDSFVRAKYMPSVKRQYVGYVAWRATVPESEVSETTRKLAADSILANCMTGQHCIMYTIPGHNGTLEPGKRMVNFLWYTNETDESLNELLTDAVDGHKHHNTVPEGRLKQEIWDRRVKEASKVPFAPAFLDVATKIKQPFVQVITESCSPQAAFEDGRVLLIGDGLAQFRPHAAMSGSQAAFHSLAVDDYLAGRIATAEEWEAKVVDFSWIYYLMNVWWGNFYQSRLPVALVYGVYFWGWVGYDKIKAWWRGGQS